VGAPTWIRGERQLLDTTGKNPVVSCPFSFTFKQFTEVFSITCSLLVCLELGLALDSLFLLECFA